MKSRTFRQVAACVALVAGSLAVASPAQAANVKTCTWYGCSGSWGAGSGTWHQDGDRMTVCDNYADGWSVVVVATFNTGGEQYKWRTAGAGCSDRSYGNLREGTGFYFRTCLGHAADNFISWATCGNTEITTA
jgi:hypothetical protein